MKNEQNNRGLCCMVNDQLYGSNGILLCLTDAVSLFAAPIAKELVEHKNVFPEFRQAIPLNTEDPIKYITDCLENRYPLMGIEAFRVSLLLQRLCKSLSNDACTDAECELMKDVMDRCLKEKPWVKVTCDSNGTSKILPIVGVSQVYGNSVSRETLSGFETHKHTQIVYIEALESNCEILSSEEERIPIPSVPISLLVWVEDFGGSGIVLCKNDAKRLFYDDRPETIFDDSKWIEFLGDSLRDKPTCLVYRFPVSQSSNVEEIPIFGIDSESDAISTIDSKTAFRLGIDVGGDMIMAVIKSKKNPFPLGGDGDFENDTLFVKRLVKEDEPVPICAGVKPRREFLFQKNLCTKEKKTYATVPDAPKIEDTQKVRGRTSVFQWGADDIKEVKEMSNTTKIVDKTKTAGMVKGGRLSGTGISYPIVARISK